MQSDYAHLKIAMVRWRFCRDCVTPEALSDPTCLNVRALYGYTNGIIPHYDFDALAVARAETVCISLRFYEP